MSVRCLVHGLCFAFIFTCAGGLHAETADTLRRIDPQVVPDKDALRSMVATDLRERIRAANRRSTGEWHTVHSQTDWEKLRDAKLSLLRQSLGSWPEAPADLHVETVGTLPGDGFQIERIVFESRPGLLVTADLYVPAERAAAMPGILICHSHHNPKTEGELQDMGMLWARQGCTVLVMDQIGHGERRQHPFRSADDFPEKFRVSRQDYFFRHNIGQQLHLVGDSLIGWMAWDLMRGVDLLRKRPGVDPDRIVLLGAVAGGGDPAAVTAALDPRIAAAVPFNFGGPQPESQFPLPENAEDRFNYAGGGSWESTRNLRLSARDGFLPWVIVGSIVPRGLVYSHEFAWDREHDPVWARLQAIFGYANAGDHLAFTHGSGSVKGQPPESTHCNNIGAVHRRLIYPAFERWFSIPIAKEEYQHRRSSQDLLCLSGPNASSRTSKSVHQMADELADRQIAAMRKTLSGKSSSERRAALRERWSQLLGDVAPYDVKPAQDSESSTSDGVRVEKHLLGGDRDIRLPVMMLIPARPAGQRLPVVVAIAQDGKAGFLKHREELLAALLNSGVAICLPDLRGTGESRSGSDRGRSSAATALSSSALMLGTPIAGEQLRDLRSVLAWLRTRSGFDAQRIAVHGDAFAPVNGSDARLEVPFDLDQPQLGDPSASLVALLAALFEDDLAATSAQGGLVSFRSLLTSPFLHVPHDAVIPGATTAGDVSDLAQTSRAVWISGLVDGLNRAASENAVRSEFKAISDRADSHVQPATADQAKLAAWLRERLK